MFRLCFTVVAFALLSTGVLAGTLRVGPLQALKFPSQAALIAKRGDVIEIDAGDYRGDVAVWRADNLTIRGVNGMVHLRSAGVVAMGKAIWVIKGNHTSISHIAFYDARAKDRNGAGIRLEGMGLTVRYCLFRDNENGILTGASRESEVLVENSEFDHNGFGDGRSHNLYIGAIRKFTLRNSHSHRARIGHQVKSRAAENVIVGNVLEDGPSGHSSYLIDLPAGGVALISGNTLRKGPLAENSTMVSYGAEKMLYPRNSLSVWDNAFINGRPGRCILVNIKKSPPMPADVRGNRFTGCNSFLGPVTALNNSFNDQQLSR